MKEKALYLGHRERLKNRFKISQSRALYDYELLELLLTFAIPRIDVKPLAKKLLKTFKSLSSIMDAGKEELMLVPGIGERSAVLIKLVKEFVVKYFEDPISHPYVLSSPTAAVDFAKAKLGGLSSEVFMAIFLNTKNEVIDYDIIHEGTIDQTIIYPRRIVEQAIQYHAGSMIIFHNHPSGHCSCSEEDKVITGKLKEILNTIDVRLLDHIIVTKNNYFSFQEESIL